MKANLTLPKEFFSPVNRLSTSRIVTVIVLTLCLGISPAWGAKPAAKQGAVIFVDASAPADGDGMSWETAFTDLQDALDQAVSGDQIWVAAGTYKPTSSVDRSISFVLKSGVKVYGGFAGGEKALRERSLDPSLTILSGDIGTIGDDTDNSRHVVYANGVTEAVFDGFTVTLGYSQGGSDYANYLGAGMYTRNSAFAVSNCIFSNNKTAVTQGSITSAGAGMHNKDSALTVTGCTFSRNQAGNAYIDSWGQGGGICNDGEFSSGTGYRFTTITGCTFSDNLASSRPDMRYGGGGMYNNDCNPTIDRCTFERNLAGCGGAIFHAGSMPIITNCIFNTNSNSHQDGYGGAIFNLGGARILNSTFYQNGWRLMPVGYPEPRFRPYTRVGGAVVDWRGGSLIANCIFSKNAVTANGAAIVSGANSVWRGTTLNNCLFYENISYPPYEPQRIYHIQSIINADSADNVFDVDPLLVNPGGGDFHLRYDSPCIDAGLSIRHGNYVWPNWLPSTDFEGDKRIVDSDADGAPVADIGADESVPNLPDLGWFLQELADGGDLDEATAARLLSYVDDAQAALDQEEKKTAINLLNDLIAYAWASLDDTETAQIIEMKTEAVIEEI